MKNLASLLIFSLSFSQLSDSPNNLISQLELAVENASRSGQVVWAEEFSGLS